MKRILVLVAIVICLVVTGCEDKPKNILGGWETVGGSEQVKMDDEVLKIFNDAKSNYSGADLELVALLAEQIVSGKNYMFLAREYQDDSRERVVYKIVIVYNDLENNSTITHVKDFHYTKYVNENFENDSSDLTGGWTINIPSVGGVLDEDVQSAFDNATSELIKLTGTTYTPIAVLGKQIVSGTNYAVICYGKEDNSDALEGIYVLTLYKSAKDTEEITSQAYVDLSVFNK